MKNNNSPVADFFKKVWLLLRCMITSVSFAALFSGIAIVKSSHGIYIIIIASILLILSIYYNIIMPVARIPKKKK